MAIIKACKITTKPKNTGKQCDTAMAATAMLIAMDAGLEFTDSDLADPVAWLTQLIHQKKAWPLFGQKAPIREVNNDQSADVIVELDDGFKVYLRPGMYNRTYATTSGGLCFAEAVESFLNSGKHIVEVDIQGQMLARTNEGKSTYSPLITDMLYAPAPILADLKTTPYKNRFSYSFSPTEMIRNGIIFTGASALLSMQGLIDSMITKAAATTQTGFTSATGGRTITAVGADNDTYNMKVNGVTISGDVVKTAAESTVTLLAAKVVAAINALTATNGGYTATNVAGAITVTAPSGLGATINTVQVTATIVGTITDGTPVAFSGGVTGTTKLKIGVSTTCSLDDLIAKFGANLAKTTNFRVENLAALGTAVGPTAAGITSGVIELSGPYIKGRTYRVWGAAPDVWLASGVEGYDASEGYVDIVVS